MRFQRSFELNSAQRIAFPSVILRKIWLVYSEISLSACSPDGGTLFLNSSYCTIDHAGKLRPFSLRAILPQALKRVLH